MHINRVKMHAMADKLLVRLLPELKDLIDREATAKEVEGGMGELAVQILAEHFKRPDLARVPRKKMGRPRKVILNGNGRKHAKASA